MSPIIGALGISILAVVILVGVRVSFQTPSPQTVLSFQAIALLVGLIIEGAILMIKGKPVHRSLLIAPTDESGKSEIGIVNKSGDDDKEM